MCLAKKNHKIVIEKHIEELGTSDLQFYDKTKSSTVMCSTALTDQASVLSGEEKSFIDSVWSLILVKSKQYTVEGFDFAEINDMLCFIVTS